MKQTITTLDKELGVLSEVGHAYSWLAQGAERVARGMDSNVALEPGAWIRHLAELAAQLAEKHPSRWRRFSTPFPDPCGGLGTAVEKLVRLESERGLGSAREEARRAAMEWWRMQGAAEAMEEAHLNLYVVKMDSEAQIAAANAAMESAKAGMYKALGKAEAEAKARERADEERKKAEAKRLENELALARWQERNAPMRRGRYEVTQKEVAKQLGVSVPTVKAWERDRGTPPAGYTREKRRTRAGFAAFVAGLRRDLSTEENMMEAAGRLRLGNRRGMGVKKGTK